MATIFRETATIADHTGRFRTSILLASRLNGDWSETAKAEQVRRNGLPMIALTVTDAEYDRMEADRGLRLGYVDAAGDVTSPFDPFDWAA